jgi:predicted nuclease of restriction endonuclease-like (RecB) superfamily
MPTKRPIRPQITILPQPSAKNRAKAGKARLYPVNTPAYDDAFKEIVGLIQTSQRQALQTANTALIVLYRQVGEYISRKIEEAAWGEGVVDQLARYIAHRHPEIRGFNRQNLYRMRKFHEVYRRDAIGAPLAHQLSWTHNILIMAHCKIPEERIFYLRTATQENWNKRELQRQIDGRLFERVIQSPLQSAPAVKRIHPSADQAFKDSYLLDFLDLPARHSEKGLQQGLVADIKRFLTEIGRDFCYIGEQYPLQVGGEDFFIDLLFYHRELQCLVAFELKIERFKPHHLGQLSFYLEALDRDVRKPHEKPSVGILLCADKNSEVVEYALNRTLSPALVAQYQTRLPDRTLLQRKLAEFYEMKTKRPG